MEGKVYMNIHWVPTDVGSSSLRFAGMIDNDILIYVFVSVAMQMMC